MRKVYSSITAYISEQPKEHQQRLTELYKFIKKLAPEASEKMSWAMPTFYQNGNLVHFAFHKNHIGFYPGDEAIQHFEKRLQPYKHSKGAVQFPHTQELPYDLIKDIVLFRVAAATK